MKGAYEEYALGVIEILRSDDPPINHLSSLGRFAIFFSGSPNVFPL